MIKICLLCLLDVIIVIKKTLNFNVKVWNVNKKSSCLKRVECFMDQTGWILVCVMFLKVVPHLNGYYKRNMVMLFGCLWNQKPINVNHSLKFDSCHVLQGWHRHVNTSLWFCFYLNVKNKAPSIKVPKSSRSQSWNGYKNVSSALFEW